MKKTAIHTLFILLLSVSLCHAADSVRTFQGSGEVTSVDPMYSKVTIEHGVIKGFAHDGVSEFYVSDQALLKDIATRDTVEFEIVDTKGDAKISKITKTGVAPPKEEGVSLGRAVNDTLQGTGEVLKAVTSPLPPVSEAIGGAADSAGLNADARIQDGEVKQKLATF